MKKYKNKFKNYLLQNHSLKEFTIFVNKLFIKP